MKERRRAGAALIFSLFFCLLCPAQSALAAQEMKVIDLKGQNIHFEAPVFLPPESVEGNEGEGAVVFGNMTERGMFERLFAVYWGKESKETMSPFPAGQYKLFSEIPAAVDDKDVNGHAADFSKGVVKITRPCGQVSDGSMLICRFYCPETKRHFLFLDLLDTVTDREFVGIVKSFKCH